MRNNLLWTVAYAGCVASIVIGLIVSGATPFISRQMQTAAVFFVQSTTSTQIQNNYVNAQSAKKVRILIVPGHQPDTGGTEFNDVYERDIVVDIADALATLLSQNSRYDVIVSRTKLVWNPILQTYFDTQATEILTLVQSQKLQMQKYLAEGSILPEDEQVYHNKTAPYTALQLFGINKWASENNIDITLHLHLNDYAGRRKNKAGKYDGFTIYVPDSQYSNAEASRSIAEAIAVRLNAYHATSTLPQEDDGVVPDQWLIATGANNTANNAALLIEYGYIYEPQFQKSSVRQMAVDEYAYETYLGLQDFFKDPTSSRFSSVSFPYDWSVISTENGASGPGIFALQSALHYLGYYPPKGRSFSDCPVSGISGSCTRATVSAYQSAHGLEATGTLGPKTRAELERDLLTSQD